MPFELLLAMQAAGMITDYMGVKNQQGLMSQGAQVEQAGIDAEIEQTKLETADASLQGLTQLRQNIGSQMAVFAARGTSTSAGNAFQIINNTVGNFNADERIRRINQLGKMNELKAGKTISILNQAGGSSKLWQGFASRTINRFPSSVAGWKQGIKDAKEAFGLTSLGG
jgi:hypothetical protein